MMQIHTVAAGGGSICRFDGARLNSPNDITCCRRDGAVWFTDPDFGIGGHWEGEPAAPQRPHGVYRIDVAGRLDCVIDEVVSRAAELRDPE